MDAPKPKIDRSAASANRRERNAAPGRDADAGRSERSRARAPERAESAPAPAAARAETGPAAAATMASPSRRISSSPVLTGRDFPRDLLDQWPRGATVFLRLRVDARGYVSECTVDRGTGVAAIDSDDCNLAHDRLRFRPGAESQRTSGCRMVRIRATSAAIAEKESHDRSGMVGV